MKHIFLNLELELEVASKHIFNALGITINVLEGDSANSQSGVYFIFSVFGANIKIELNSYDWDNEYNYMVSIKKDTLSNIQITEENEKMMAEIICDLLYRNLQTEVAMEVGDNLVIYNP